jgi:hypothetical protein
MLAADYPALFEKPRSEGPIKQQQVTPEQTSGSNG